jgi:acetoin utilization protein AcuB
MFAKNYINHTIPFLKPTDSVEQALEILQEFKLNAMVLVTENKVQAIVTEQTIMDLPEEMELKNIPFFQKEEHVFEENTPFFEVLKLVSQIDKDVFPIVDLAQNYLGTVTKLDLYQKLVDGLSLNAEGGIIEIKLKDDSYSFSEIARLIEQEHAHILSMFMFTNDADEKSILMKLDAPQISYIVHSLERFGYEVLSYYSTEQVGSLEKDRFDLLMKYLNI